eukprot:333612-Amphidinium_carterae.1
MSTRRRASRLGPSLSPSEVVLAPSRTTATRSMLQCACRGQMLPRPVLWLCSRLLPRPVLWLCTRLLLRPVLWHYARGHCGDGLIAPGHIGTPGQVRDGDRRLDY